MTAAKLRPSALLDVQKLRDEIFTPAIVEMVVKGTNNGALTANAQAALADRLNEAVRIYFTEIQDEEEASPSQVAKAAGDLSKACARALEVVGMGQDADLADMYPALGGGALFAFAAQDGGGRQDVGDAFAGIARLKRWSDALCFSSTIQARRQKQKNTGSPAYAGLLSNLGEAYLACWNDIPGRSTSADGMLGGPFIRFLLHVTNHIAATVRGFRRKQPAALAAAWRRTEAAQEMAVLRKASDDMAKLGKNPP